jgi:hypothetical protein
MVLPACQNIAFGKFGCVWISWLWQTGYFLTTFYLSMSGGMTGSMDKSTWNKRTVVLVACFDSRQVFLSPVLSETDGTFKSCPS